MNEIAERQDTTPAEATNIMEAISRAASDPSIEIDKFERLMSMYERIEGKRAEQAYNAAMSEAQAEMGRVSADATNPQTRSKYASYHKLDKALRPVYTRHGFSLSFDTGEAPGPEVVRVVCHVSHSGGHTRTHHVDMPADGKGAKGGDVMTKTHAAGSAMSYGMRYLLKLIFNVAVGEDDDDGNRASAGPTISDEQVAEIRQRLKDAGRDESRYLKHAKLNSLSEIPEKNYESVLAEIDAVAQRAKAKGDAQA